MFTGELHLLYYMYNVQIVHVTGELHLLYYMYIVQIVHVTRELHLLYNNMYKLYNVHVTCY